jgi:thioredoxin-like negative regulator of GroEL
VALDRDGSVAKKYGVRSIPNVFVVDSSGVIRYNGHGVEEAAKVIEGLLPGGGPGAEKPQDEA